MYDSRRTRKIIFFSGAWNQFGNVPSLGMSPSILMPNDEPRFNLTSLSTVESHLCFTELGYLFVILVVELFMETFP
jgi:hypothetical protein